MPERKDKSEAKEKEVLDLLGGRPKRAKAVKAEAPPAEVSAPEPQKAQALDLLSHSRKKAAPKAKPVPADVVAETATPLVEPETVPAPAETEKGSGLLSIKSSLSVSELSALSGLKQHQIIKALMPMNIFGKAETILEPDTIAALCDALKVPYEREKREKGAGVHKVVETVVEPPPAPVEKAPTRTKRIPIVTIMGHVDHGKTSLLDYIRKSKVTAGEAGGITQHIAAYTVEHEGEQITFLDTPGHAIFTEMRARGADVTDIVVVVVAANDGIMPQTREAIAHALAAKKTVIVAINKCDLPSADPMRTKTGLMEEGLVPTDFGGSIECIEISAITGQGIPDLLELLVLQAEVLELQADPKANCRASVIEARVQPGKGTTATVIVEAGTLKIGKPFICGSFAGKIRSMLNDCGESIKKALPGMPVEVVGFEEIPNVGDQIVQMDSERAAKKLAEERQMKDRQARLTSPRKSRMEDIMSMMQVGSQKAQLKVVLKCDVQGSVEAIKKAISDIKSVKVETIFLHAAVGPISESDILLASSSNGVILGFNVKVEANAVRAAKRENVQVKLYSIVYELIDQVRDAMLGLLTPETRETVIGHANVLQVFKLNKGRAAGCYVNDGKVERTAGARVIRDGQPVFDGKMSTLRRFQDEVGEVKSGLECGIRLGEFNEYEVGDVIECYTLEKIKQTL